MQFQTIQKKHNLRTKTVIYARVSSNAQRKTNFETQAERMQNFCTSNGWTVDRVVKEVGSRLNDECKKLLSIFKDPHVKRIVVANKTMDNDKNDIIADFTAIITSFRTRLYSKRRGKNKADALKNYS